MGVEGIAFGKAEVDIDGVTFLHCYVALEFSRPTTPALRATPPDQEGR
jgi:hypothetical protein